MEPDVEAIAKGVLLRLLDEAEEPTLSDYILQEIGPDSGLTEQQIQGVEATVLVRLREKLMAL